MTFVAKLELPEIDRLEEAIRNGAFELKEVAYARISGRGEGVNCTIYSSGKCVIQGKGMEQFILNHLPGHRLPGEIDPDMLEMTQTVVGSDESGKGDYFGPLVTAAVALGPKDLAILEETRIVDSKTMTPASIRRSAAIIRDALPHEIVVVGPERYNQLYEKFANLNRMLAWCHGSAIERVLERSDADLIVVDKFCEDRVLRQGLKPRALGMKLMTMPRAERNPAVAAASVLASDAFTRALESMGKSWSLTFPKGASAAVDAAGRRFVKVQGREALAKVAKLHFKTTNKL